MRGKLYACEWLEDDYDGPARGGKVVTSRTRALWVPEAGLVFQWTLPNGKTVQVTETTQFPPPTTEARATFLEDRTVPYAAVRSAREYLKRQEHIHAQEAVIQQAQHRITDAAVRCEGRFQAALTKAGLQS